MLNKHKVRGSIFSTRKVKTSRSHRSLEMSWREAEDPGARETESNLFSCPTRSPGAPSVDFVSCSLNLTARDGQLCPQNTLCWWPPFIPAGIRGAWSLVPSPCPSTPNVLGPRWSCGFGSYPQVIPDLGKTFCQEFFPLSPRAC